MVGKRKNILKKVMSIVLFVVGLTATSYPLISSIMLQREQKNTVATYEKAASASDDSYIMEALENAEEYNRVLFETGGITVGCNSDILSEENYNNLLNVSGSGIMGVMGSIEIPKIEVNLPIYHGTSDEVLNVGVGHLMESSLPVGGENTRAVLTGHRGLPNSKLFTRLDELEIGDLFYIRILNDTLAYQVCDIDVIDPEDIDSLQIQEGRDLVTLLTCHPYGINTHRLIVTGERIAYEEEVYSSIESEMMSIREIVFTVLPFLFIGIGLVTVIKNRNNKKKVIKKNENEIKEDISSIDDVNDVNAACDGNGRNKCGQSGK